MEHQWPSMRWVMLAMGVFSSLVCTFWAYIPYRLVHEGNGGQLDSFAVFIIAMEWTKCCMFFVLGAWCFITAWSKWRGDVNHMLLLRLLDAQQNQPATEPNEN